MADGERDDIGADLRAAMTEQIEAPAAHDDVAADLTAATKEVESREAPEDGRVRDERGRFAPKQPEPIEGAADIKSAAPESAATDAPVMPPRHWKPEAKAEFQRLPPELRQAVLEHEAAVGKESSELQPKAQRLAAIESILAPHKGQWAVRGLDEIQAIKTLVDVSAWLDRDAPSAVAALARQYGLTPQQIFGQAAPQSMPQYAPQNGAPPEWMQRLETLEQREQQRVQQTRQAQMSGAQQAIAEFQADPKNLYFENVKEEMALLLNAGKANDLQTAYDMAVWQRPDTRKLVIAQERANEAAKAKADAAAKVAAARSAGGSVIGSPGPGQSVHAPSSKGSVKDDLLAAWNEAMQ